MNGPEQPRRTVGGIEWSPVPIPTNWRELMQAAPSTPAPSTWWEALTRDGWHELRAILFGDGGAAPFQVLLRIRPRDPADIEGEAPPAGATLAAPRWPTLGELSAAVELTLEGAGFPFVLVAGEKTYSVPLDAVEGVTIQLTQVGAAGGPAAIRMRLAGAGRGPGPRGNA